MENNLSNFLSVRFAFGIPTVSRKKAYYVVKTVESLLQNMNGKEQNDAVIVVMVADTDEKYIEKVVADMERNFPEAIEEGRLQVIIPCLEYYPDLKSLPHLYNDGAERVEWRSRQALDYSFLFFYSIDLAEYYIQLEDDVEAVDGFYRQMNHFIRTNENEKWSILEFGKRGFIGMMYRNKDLVTIAKFTRFFFWVMPVDWLFRAFNDIVLYGNSKEFKNPNPLFKHVGQYSSLSGQVRLLEDLQDNRRQDVLANIKKPFKTLKPNPEAVIHSSIVDYVHPNVLENPYKKKGFFWGKFLSRGDFIEIRFSSPQNMKRIVIESGSYTHQQDIFDETNLLVASTYNEIEEKCSNFKHVAAFHGKLIDHTFKPLVEPIKCLKVILQTVKMSNGFANWLIIQNIEIVI